MAEPVLRITHGDYTFDFRGLTAKEMAKVKTETGFTNRGEFFDAITDEDPNAMIAAFVLARTRQGETVRWGDVDVDLDTVEAGYYDDTDRQVEPVFQTDDDGSLVLDDDGDPKPSRDKQGRVIWRYVDTGEEVPPTDSAETTPSPATTPTPSESPDSASPTPALSIA